MSAFIHSISTSVPDHFYPQEFLREKMKEYVGEKRSTRSIIHRIYANSGIEKRHSVINDFSSNGHQPFYFQKDGTLSSPSTGTRNQIYAKHAKKFFADIAQNLLRKSSFNKEQITHVITVSCTGFFAPDPAFEIVKKLGLCPSTQRFHLGFMGCFAALPALKMAQSFCLAQPDAVVMVICLELCSIHFQASSKTDNLISASVFADGGAGALVSARQPDKPAFAIRQFATSVADESQRDMAWTIGDTGFDMVLSTYVPDIIESNLPVALQPLLDAYDICPQNIKHWAIHPGGRAILDKIERSFDLENDQLQPSRSVLSRFGNMSSATILFVLKELLDGPNHKGSDNNVLAMAFGPGLTIETGLLTLTNS